jgi:CO/xanthine dehydrogenase Mo-binding subunit
MGNAILGACREVKRQIKEVAAEHSCVPGDSIQVAPGILHLPGGERSFEQFLEDRFGKVKGEVIGVGSARSELLKGHPMGGNPAYYEFMCTATELEIDKETGETRITKLINVGDVGKALNPQYVEMQDEGGAIQGLGHSVMKHFILDEAGHVKNLGALDYRIPTIKDIPLELKAILVENGDGPGPYGAKGCGEAGILAVAPSVGGAVEEATGVRIRELPLTPERIWMAINKIKEKE